MQCQNFVVLIQLPVDLSVPNKQFSCVFLFFFFLPFFVVLMLVLFLIVAGCHFITLTIIGLLNFHSLVIANLLYGFFNFCFEFLWKSTLWLTWLMISTLINNYMYVLALSSLAKGLRSACRGGGQVVNTWLAKIMLHKNM